MLLTLLGSIEVVLIPQRLQLYGLSPSDSLGIYGVFTGMALPLILFPSTVTNSASVMLMPSVAEMQALGFRKRIRHITGKACTGCILLGAFCAAGFFFSVLFLAIFFSQSHCRSLHPHHGLYLSFSVYEYCSGQHPSRSGKNVRSLLHNAAGILVRISFVLLLSLQWESAATCTGSL